MSDELYRLVIDGNEVEASPDASIIQAYARAGAAITANVGCMGQGVCGSCRCLIRREGEREGERRELSGPDAGLEPTRSALRTPWAPGNLPMALPPGASFDPEPPSGTI